MECPGKVLSLTDANNEQSQQFNFNTIEELLFEFNQTFWATSGWLAWLTGSPMSRSVSEAAAVYAYVPV